MNAIISGRAGLALIADGDILYSIRYGDSQDRVSRRAEDFWHLFGDAGDLKIVQQTDAVSVERLLSIAAEGEEILDLTLILLDSELTFETRTQAAEELDALLVQDEAARHAENFLFAHPLPTQADLAGAIAICSSRFDRVHAHLRGLERLQPVICDVRAAWEAAIHVTPAAEVSRDELQSLASQRGLFRALVLGVFGEQPLVAAAAFSIGIIEQEELPGGREFVSRWTEYLRTAAAKYRQPDAGVSIDSDCQEETQPDRPSPRELPADKAGAVPSVQSGIVDAEQRYNRYASANEAQHAGAYAALPNYPDRLVKDMANVFRLLADETRLQILLHLMRTNELHVRALCDILKQSQPAVSHHLALLRVAELVESRREGKHNYYRILPHRFQELLDLVFSAVPKEDRFARFEDYVVSYDAAPEIPSPASQTQ